MTNPLPPPDLPFRRALWLFHRLLALVYLAAFWSAAVQVRGLVGSLGVLPAADFLRAVHDQVGVRGYWFLPTVFWFTASDAALVGACWIGVVLALVRLATDRLRLAVLPLLYLLYLSIVSAGQVFFGYQWDGLLLEAGFLAIFLIPVRERFWLGWWLLFRLMFLSGFVKLASGDSTWRSLTALRFHYETQPLPTPVAWYLHQLPGWLQTASCAAVLAVELGLPFLIPFRRTRRIGAAGLIFLQVLILISGNYAFFNWLTIALCVLLLDDAALPRWVPSAAVVRERRSITAAVVILLASLTGLQTAQTIGLPLPSSVQRAMGYAGAWQIATSYGLFAVMTTERDEIILEGSNDGEHWTAYEFRYKPGSLRRGPPWVAPHQPRLDWQMWFAALGTARDNPWFANLVVRLLQGSPDVLALLEKNPFPAGPPRYIRAGIYEYKFSPAKWWMRERKGEYFPPVGRKGPEVGFLRQRAGP